MLKRRSLGVQTFQTNMALNGRETRLSKTATTNSRSVIHCPEASDLTWNLKETTIHWILLPITIVASLAVIGLNLLVTLAVHRKRELKRTSTILFSSMAIADLLVGAISMPLTVTADILIIRQVYYSGFCTLYLATEYSMFYFIWSSLHHLTLIAWERFVAVRKWIDYKAIVTRERIKALAIVAWLLAAFTSFPPLVMLMVGVDYHIHEAWHIGEGVVAVVCLIVIGYYYIMVYHGVRKRKSSEISQRTALRRAKLESRVAMTTGLITFALIVSFVPVIVVGGLGDVFPVLLTSKAFRLPQALVQFNSLANPLIYIYRDCRLRNAVLELFGISRPGKIQPVVDAVRFVRRKDPFDLLESVKERQESVPRTRLQRAASWDPAVVSNCDVRKSGEIWLKRSMSVPTLDKCSGPAGGPQLQKTLPMEVRSSTIHPQKGERHQGKTSNVDLPQDSIKPQDTGHLFRYIPRSKSWDASAFLKCANRTCQMLQETSVQRPTTAPFLQSERNCSARLTRDSGSFTIRF